MRLTHFIFCLLIVQLTLKAHAQPSAQAAPPASDSSLENHSETLNKLIAPTSQELDIGVITDQVITVAGQDFYSYFAAAWRDKEGTEKITLAIHELPSARWGNEIWIEYAQRKIFRSYLPPSRAAIQSMSLEAVESTFKAVQQANVQRRLVVDADLARDEF